MAGWTTPINLLKDELTQRRDEGVQVPGYLRQRIAELHPEADAWNLQRIDPLYDALMALPEDPALAAREPNDLAEIRALRPEGPRDLAWHPSDDDLFDRMHGVWTGRAAGCALGKPVEGMGMAVDGGRLVGRARIKAYLQNRGDWPLRDFFSNRDAGDGLKIACEASQRERIAYMEADDDIHYSLVGLGVVEKHGPEFAWKDVAYYWTDHIPFGMICTAETQAILNFWNRCMRWNGPNTVATTPAVTRRFRNPYREWIGAQIRSDGWAWCCAGRPELAAEFAWRDACWTHERNGIYGAMFCAAMQAAAFVESDPRRLVEIGLSEIPGDCRLARAVRATRATTWVADRALGDCRLARAVRATLDLVAREGDWEACMAQVEGLCAAISPDHRAWSGLSAGMSPVHTINNALVCVLGLAYGRMDTVEAPAIAVMCGLDTDCNGATVGSIVGAAAGRGAFKDDLASRLNDTIKPSMVGFAQVTMTELAQRTVTQWKRVAEWAGKRG